MIPNTTLKFRDLKEGETFCFPPGAFSHLCERISARKYRSLRDGLEHRVGTIDCAVRVYREELHP